MRALPELPHSCAKHMWEKDPGRPGTIADCSCDPVRIFEHRDLTWWRALTMRFTNSVPAQFAGVWVDVTRRELAAREWERKRNIEAGHARNQELAAVEDEAVDRG